jgi:hypothetical protein
MTSSSRTVPCIGDGNLEFSRNPRISDPNRGESSSGSNSGDDRVGFNAANATPKGDKPSVETCDVVNREGFGGTPSRSSKTNDGGEDWSPRAWE